MKLEKRDYQTRTVLDTCQHLKKRSSVCIASAVASGKTVMGAQVVRELGWTTLWVAHRQELVHQAAEKLRSITGKKVGIHMPDYAPSMAEIQVGTIQTLLNLDLRKQLPQLLVLDETHHYEADVWKQITKLAKSRKKNRSLCLGLTATPERSDGRPLGDTFDTLVIGAQYSELLEAGQVVPWTIYTPKEALGADLALDPLFAYQQLTPGQKALVYHGRVEHAKDWAEKFRKAGIYSECVHGGSERKLRADHVGSLSKQKGARVDVLHNVGIMTEGVDIPDVSVIILCRPLRFAGSYIQVTGRAARKASGKTHATLIDLIGSSLFHGPPHSNWEYSLRSSIKKKVAEEEEATTQEEEKEKRKVIRLDPQIKNTGLYLSTESSYLPDPQTLPAFDPPERHGPSYLHQVKAKVVGKKGASPAIAESIAAITSGMLE